MARTTAATVWSNVLPSVWMTIASGAVLSGAVLRLESIVSRRSMSSEDLARLALVGGPALGGAPAGSLLGGGVEVDLHVRVGQDHRPDVTAGHDDPAVDRELALTRNEGGPQLRHLRVGGDGAIDRGPANLRGHVPAGGAHPPQAAARVGDEGHLGDQRHERRDVGRGHAALQGQPGHRAIEQPGVAEAVAQPSRGLGPDGALAARAGAVDGHDQAPSRAAANLRGSDRWSRLAGYSGRRRATASTDLV